MTICLAYFSQLEDENQNQDLLFEEIIGRTSITFIMGEDKTEVDYYSNAIDHFVFDTDEKTDLVVNTCRTIKHVIDYLNNSSERGNVPWSIINVVAHSNPKTGLNLDLFDEGPKATPKRLLQAVLLGSLPKLRKSRVDKDTKINFWSCGIGKNPIINLSLKAIFKPEEGDSAQVYCSPHFVIFHPSKNGDSAQRLKASYWPYYYKRGYRPSISEIEYAMRNEFPDEEIDWSSALNSETMDSSAFHQSYHIPISYIKVFTKKTDRPDFDSENSKIEWIKSQRSIRDQLYDTDIPFEKFNWQVNKIIHTDESGNRVPAVKAIGMATVLNVLRIE